jgi:hypothetical protein
VLLFGSESWVLTDTAMRVLEGFHVRSAYWMAREHKPRKNNDTGVWRYPSTEEVLAEVGLLTIRQYIEVRRQTIANYIVHWPIFDLCLGEERRRGTSKRLWWWEQRMDLDLVREMGDVISVVAEDEESMGSWTDEEV